MFKKIFNKKKPDVAIISKGTGNNNSIKLDIETQREYLQLIIEYQCNKNYESGKLDFNKGLTNFVKSNHIKHGIYNFKNPNVKVNLHYALLFWTIHNGKLMIICKQSRKTMKGLYYDGVRGEIIKVPYLLEYVIKERKVHCIVPAEYEFFLLKLQPSEGKKEFYPDRDFLHLNDDCKDLPFHVPISYQKQNGEYRKGYLMLYRGTGLMTHFGEWKNSVQFAKLSLKIKIKFILNILNALEQIHNKNCVHRDVKLDNFVMDKGVSNFAKKKVYIIDLEDIKKRGKNDKDIYGTFCYLAPETAKKIKISWISANMITQASDVYSMGITLTLLLQSDIHKGLRDLENVTIAYKENKPFSTTASFYNIYCKHARSAHKKLVENLENSRIRGVISKMTEEDPQLRLTIKEVIKDFKRIL